MTEASDKAKADFEKYKTYSSPKNPYELDNKTYLQHIAYEKAYREEYRKYVFETLKVQEALDKIEKICKEYNIGMWSGCGCCGDGGTVEDKDGHKFSFSFGLQ